MPAAAGIGYWRKHRSSPVSDIFPQLIHPFAENGHLAEKAGWKGQVDPVLVDRQDERKGIQYERKQPSARNCSTSMSTTHASA